MQGFILNIESGPGCVIGYPQLKFKEWAGLLHGSLEEHRQAGSPLSGAQGSIPSRRARVSA